jgi:Zinc-binding dehydrogenase
MDNFDPHIIPNTVCLTMYSSSPEKFMDTLLNEIAERVADGSLDIPVKTFRLDQIVEAHTAMDESTAGAKIVVLV